MKPRPCAFAIWFLGILIPIGFHSLPAAAAEAAIVPDLVLDTCNDSASTLTVEIRDVIDLQGYQADVTVDESVLRLPTTDPYGFGVGSFLGSDIWFHVTKLAEGHYRVIETKLGPPGVDGAGPLFTITGDPSSETVLDAQVSITSMIARNHLNQTIPVELGGPAIVRIDCTSPDFTLITDPRSCLRGSGAGDPVTATLTASDSGGVGAGLDRIESQYVSGASDCDHAGAWGTLVDSLGGSAYGPAQTALPDPPSPGEWTFLARAVDLAGNTSDCRSFTFRYVPDTTLAVTNLRAEPGYHEVQLDWTMPQIGSGQEVWIVRKCWNADSTSGFPGYAIGGPLAGGAYPTSTADGRVVFRTATLSSAVDTVGVVGSTPDIYLYRAFVVDCLDFQNGGQAPADISADFASENLGDAADAATNYWLGDIDDAIGVPYQQDGAVTSVDLAALSGSFGTIQGEAGYVPEADFGPSEMPDGSPTGVARPDGQVEFEDVIILSINYGSVGPLQDDPIILGPDVATKAPPSVDLRVSDAGTGPGRIVGAIVRLENGDGVRGIRTVLRYDPLQLEPIGAQAGDAILARPDATFHSAIRRSGTYDLCALTLGEGRDFRGSGVIYRVTFRARGSAPSRLALEGTKIRDLANREIGAGTDYARGTSSSGNGGVSMNRLAPAISVAPNPFHGRTAILLRLEDSGNLDVRIVDPSGRVVRSLREGSVGAGPHVLEWNGRDDGGHMVRSGAYFCEARMGSDVIRRKLILLR